MLNKAACIWSKIHLKTVIFWKMITIENNIFYLENDI